MRNNSFAGRVTRYDGTQGFVNNAKKGTPDIVCCFPWKMYADDGTVHIMIGQFVGIEIKSPNGRQSPDQKRAEEMIKNVGGDYWLIYSPEEFEEKIKEYI